jgi:hypothetical protein
MNAVCAGVAVAYANVGAAFDDKEQISDAVSAYVNARDIFVQTGAEVEAAGMCVRLAFLALVDEDTSPRSSFSSDLAK